MNFKAHLGIATGIAITVPIITKSVGIEIPEYQLDYVIQAIILGGIFPDIDTHSYPSKIYAGLSIFSLLYFAAKNMIWYGVAFMIPFLLAKVSKHRGWTHSKYTVIALAISPFIIQFIAFFLPFNIKQIVKFLENYSWLVWSFCFGMIIHDVIDVASTYMKRRK